MTTTVSNVFELRIVLVMSMMTKSTATWSVLWIVHPPHSSLLRSHPSCGATKSGICTQNIIGRKGIEIRSEVKRAVPLQRGRCERERRGSVLACCWLDWRGWNGLDMVGWQLAGRIVNPWLGCLVFVDVCTTWSDLEFEIRISGREIKVTSKYSFEAVAGPAGFEQSLDCLWGMKPERLSPIVNCSRSIGR